MNDIYGLSRYAYGRYTGRRCGYACVASIVLIVQVFVHVVGILGNGRLLS